MKLPRPEVSYLVVLPHSRPSPSLNTAVLWFKFEAATRFPSILPGGSLIPIVLRGEAVPALRPAGIPSTSSGQALPAAENKGKMPSLHGDGFSSILLEAYF